MEVIPTKEDMSSATSALKPAVIGALGETVGGALFGPIGVCAGALYASTLCEGVDKRIVAINGVQDAVYELLNPKTVAAAPNAPEVM